jgi:glycerophosphoryl diester phosphodiesterase
MNFWKQPHHTPLIVAHRGSSGIAPENTMAAFRQAMRDRADAIELDVRLTQEEELVVFHDAHLSRTTDGKGFIRNYTYNELCQLSAGAWFAREFAQQKIPLLSEVFQLVNGKVGLNVEMKPDRNRRRGEVLVDKCCELICQSGMELQVLLSSFDHSLIKIAKKNHPSIITGLLLHPLKQTVRSPVKKALKLKCDYIIFGSRTLQKRLTARAHDNGLLVAEYTVNSRRRFERALRYGVDAVITNYPVKFR